VATGFEATWAVARETNSTDEPSRAGARQPKDSAGSLSAALTRGLRSAASCQAAYRVAAGRDHPVAMLTVRPPRTQA
jgi:hypothetical protein